MRILRKCEVCGEEFIATKITNKYCSKRCARVVHRKKEAEKKKKARESKKDDAQNLQSLEIASRPFLTPSDVAFLLGVSWGGKKSQIVVDTLYCFEIVAEHKTYFFLFNPLIKVVKAGRQIGDIFLPLVKKRGYKLTDTDIENLYQFAVEFHFDWMLLPREAWISQIEDLAEDADEVGKIKEAVTAFFLKTPKCSDEREESCLKEFLKRYWTFDVWPKIEEVADKALKLIQDTPDALGKYENLKEFLKDFDECRYKFSEMSHAIVSNEN